MEKHDKNYKLRHSAAHLLAHAVIELFPDTQLTIGPVTQTGFFYDFLPTKNFKEEDLEKIAKKMRHIVKQNLKIVGRLVSKDEARSLFKDNPFKLELIDQIEDEKIGVYQQGDFYDLCEGGHVESTGKLKHFKLTGISGSYWRADREGTALQRISGVCFQTEQDLKDYLNRLEELAKYDHRLLGKQLDLFSFRDQAPGMAFFHPKGLIVHRKMIEYERYLHGTDYHEIQTPIMLNEELWKTSGHYDNYKELMYFTSAEDVNFCVRPMNCPGSILYYKQRPHSYRELPIRLAEFGYLHRKELSGVLHGLLRVRAFTMDDAHIYCKVEQIEDEVIGVLKLAERLYAKFGFEKVSMALSTRPEKFMGTQEIWDKATGALHNALKKHGVDYEVQEGEGAFYGPKIEMKMLDAMDREWQMGTVQVDFFLPMNFGLEYIDSDQSRKTPVILHRAIYGSIERFLGIMLEHYKGHLPFWLAPVQARIMTITDKQDDYAKEVEDSLRTGGVRVERDLSGGQISAQIRRAQTEKIPWMLVLGKKEEDQKTVTLRHPDGKQEFGLAVQSLIQRAQELDKF